MRLWHFNIKPVLIPCMRIAFAFYISFCIAPILKILLSIGLTALAFKVQLLNKIPLVCADLKFFFSKSER